MLKKLQEKSIAENATEESIAAAYRRRDGHRRGDNYSIQTTRDGGIVASRDRRGFVCWPSNSLSGIAALLLDLLASSSLV